MIAPPRCTVDGCTATALHHHLLTDRGGQHPEHWARCGASASARCCVPPFFYGSRGDSVMPAVRPPYRYPAPLRDLQRWSDLPEGRVWITQLQLRNRYGRKWWEVSWRVGDARRRYCLTSFDQAAAFARERVGVHRREVS